MCFLLRDRRKRRRTNDERRIGPFVYTGRWSLAGFIEGRRRGEHMRDHECGGIALDRRCAEPPRGMGSRNLRRIRAWSNVYVGGERARSLRLRRRHPPASRSMLANEKRRRVFFRRFVRSAARRHVGAILRGVLRGPRTLTRAGGARTARGEKESCLRASAYRRWRSH